MKTSKEIRKMWIDFFVSKNHLYIESKSLIPFKDPSLLWINSGVATLKDYFSGKKIPPAKRLVNSQKAIRTNDIENVGITARHHTFFEMLGNFSIGDYFKEEAIEFAHEFITKILKLEQNKLYITYFNEDIEVKNKWLSLSYKENQLIPGSRELNFWDIGSGPCGPNTEIFYDRGNKYHKSGYELISKDIENDRFIEIWNIVFSEFNNNGDGTYSELIQKNIDTGAGLERIVSIMQDGPTNFDTDLFLPIIYKIENLTKQKYKIENYFQKDLKQTIINKHFKIIADHIRAITNAIGDGEKPSNTQRGYIIRRLIRRAYYSGSRLGIKDKAFLYKLVPIVVESLIFDVDIKKVSQIIKREELIFSTTIEQGKKILDKAMIDAYNSKKFDINIAFKLYETFGFPIEMTNDILNENNYFLDFNKLQELKEKHSEISKNKQKIISFNKAINSLNVIKNTISEFIGYEHIEYKNSKIVYLLDNENEIEKTKNDQMSYLVLDKTPLYATSGGQLHDSGYMIQENNKIEVLDVFKDKFNNHVHIVKGIIDKTKPIDVFVDKTIRWGLMRNHSATHLTFAALRHVYGKEIDQLGSSNNQDRLTFDFHLEHKPKNNEIKQIENFVKEVINKNVKRNYIITDIENAKKMGAIMTIEESDYHDSNKVRIVEFPNVTSDLCGGTHIDFTKNIEAFKIISVESKGTGIYRIRAITSNKLVSNYLKHEFNKYKEIFDNSYKKYINLYKIKDTSLKQIKISTFNNTNDYEIAIGKIKENITLVTNETKKLLKEKNKINENIDFQLFKILNKLDCLIAENVDKLIFKNIAISTREKNPDKLIIVFTKFINKKSAIIITSKKINVLDIIPQLMLTFNLKGGGNNLIWQGVTTEKIRLDKLK